ncbi:MAG: glutamine synthetase family protein [Halioglobus sp.]|nr:glutamine synthetase family protein [Halioglobus sp.]
MTRPASPGEFEAFLARHPDTRMLEVLTPDMNGIFRGRRIRQSEFPALRDGSLCATITQSLVTTTGNFNDEIDACLTGGEPDRKLLHVPGSLAPVPWLESPTGQVIASLYEPDGSPCWADPRHVLQAVVGRLAAEGLRPVVATELEFYLLAGDDRNAPRPLGAGAADQHSGDRCAALEDLWENDAFIEEVRAVCEAQHVPLTAVQRESSPGQWEINTLHVEDPLLACDHTLLLKRIVKGVAFRHGIAATFMAKPFPESAGCGMHVHVSLNDDNGRNLFVNPGRDKADVAPTLRHVVGGLLETMPEAMAIFAPNANSYRRFVRGTCVPLSPCWGRNHRDVSVRLPLSAAEGLRLEHRVAGADANPYLVMAAILGGMHYGLTHHCDPGEIVEEASELPEQSRRLPLRWEPALDLFAASAWAREYLGRDYCSAFHTMRRSECEAFHASVPNLDYDWYLRSV